MLTFRIGLCCSWGQKPSVANLVLLFSALLAYPQMKEVLRKVLGLGGGSSNVRTRFKCGLPGHEAKNCLNKKDQDGKDGGGGASGVTKFTALHMSF